MFSHSLVFSPDMNWRAAVDLLWFAVCSSSCLVIGLEGESPSNYASQRVHKSPHRLTHTGAQHENNRLRFKLHQCCGLCRVISTSLSILVPQIPSSLPGDFPLPTPPDGQTEDLARRAAIPLPSLRPDGLSETSGGATCGASRLSPEGARLFKLQRQN